MPSPVTILVIDDTRHNLVLMNDLLAPQGWRILAASNGEQGLEIARKVVPELILLDVMMPGMDGFEVCERLKADPCTAEVPVIFMTALEDTGSKVRAFGGGAVDYITKPVQRDETLSRIRVHLEIRRLQASLREEIAAKDEAIRDLDGYAHTVAHDLKNPLSGIIGLTQTLLQEGETIDDEERREWYGMIFESANRLNRIVQDLLLFASVRHESVEVEPVNMSETADAMRFRLEHLIRTSDATVKIDRSMPPALAQAGWVEEIWANLISNAIKYGGRPPVVEVGAEGPDPAGRVTYWVADNGPGIPEENRKLIFDAFTRLERQRAEGTGLGLNIVLRILRKLDGSINVTDHPGGGACFRFQLPFAEIE
ncbi:MAG: hybrid sensor histidine kinase/response regulator [Opitutales bacterium]|nr:hybrid sensor histidine kinase/response regulator [Opitutales bacterium]